MQIQMSHLTGSALFANSTISSFGALRVIIQMGMALRTKYFAQASLLDTRCESIALLFVYL